MPTTHAQRVARARRPRHTVRTLTKSALIARAARLAGLPVTDIRLGDYDAADYRGLPTLTPERARWLLDQPFLSTLFPTPRAWADARDAYANKALTDTPDPWWGEALRTDDDATPFMPEDWRLECVTSRDELPEYMGSDLDGLFL